MQCEMCGKDAPLFLTKIENTPIQVCKLCTTYGQVLRAPPKPIEKKMKKEIEEPIILIVNAYASLIKTAREKRGMTQEFLAKQLGEKESVIQKIESGHFQPSIPLAKKMESTLHITLIEEETPEAILPISQKEKEGFTIADFIKKK
ncbi:TIGR00270 family protein [Candidatus Woesearchaeota archaeon]|nr:TIGR00270 family protein [Candidatus Woesearchaeota archaeon]